MTSIEEMTGTLLYDVWNQAAENHRKYSDTGSLEGDIRFHTLGMTGEAGEIIEAIFTAAQVAMASGRAANLVKKRWRDGDGHDVEIMNEIADVCAYAFMLAQCFGLTPGTLLKIIAEKQQTFIAKMKAREAK